MDTGEVFALGMLAGAVSTLFVGFCVWVCCRDTVPPNVFGNYPVDPKRTDQL